MNGFLLVTYGVLLFWGVVVLASSFLIRHVGKELSKAGVSIVDVVAYRVEGAIVKWLKKSL